MSLAKRGFGLQPLNTIRFLCFQISQMAKENTILQGTANRPTLCWFVPLVSSQSCKLLLKKRLLHRLSSSYNQICLTTPQSRRACKMDSLEAWQRGHCVSTSIPLWLRQSLTPILPWQQSHTKDWILSSILTFQIHFPLKETTLL